MTTRVVTVLAVVLSSLALAAGDDTRAADAAEKAADAAQKAAAAAQQTAEAAAAVVKAQCPPGVVPAPAAAPAPLPPGTTPWTGTVGMSLIWLTGNANTLTFNALGSADKKWNGWGLGLKGFATYGQSTLTTVTSSATTTAPEVTALAAGGHLRGDRDATNNVSIFLATGLETNHIKSIEYVVAGDAGASITWLHQKLADWEKVLLRTDLSIHAEHERDWQYYPTAAALGARDLLGPRVAASFRYALNKEVIFTQDAEVIPNIIGASRVKVNALTKVASRLTESLSMTLSFQLNYDSLPPAGKVPTDTALSAGLELAL